MQYEHLCLLSMSSPKKVSALPLTESNWGESQVPMEPLVLGVFILGLWLILPCLFLPPFFGLFFCWHFLELNPPRLSTRNARLSCIGWTVSCIGRIIVVNAILVIVMIELLFVVVVVVFTTTPSITFKARRSNQNLVYVVYVILLTHWVGRLLL